MRRSRRWVRALVIAAAACDANSVSTSSSSPGERLAVGLLGEEEVADVLVPVAHRRALEGPRERRGGRDAKRAGVAREVGEPQRPRQVAQVPEQAAAVGPGEQLLPFLGREAREEEVLGGPPSSTVAMTP